MEVSKVMGDITYTTYYDTEVVIPKNIDDFINEYEKLCKKHNLMIVADGEPICVMAYEKTLWNIRKSVAGDLDSL